MNANNVLPAAALQRSHYYTLSNLSTAVLYRYRASVSFCGNDGPKYCTAPDDASNIDPDDKAILEYSAGLVVERERDEIYQSGKRWRKNCRILPT
jgi:hypothetical protein